MILVLLGTQKNNFYRLLQEIEKCITNKIINDRVIVQSGYTDFNSDNMEIISMMPTQDFESLLAKADLVITHGGVGSIINSIKLHKKVIAVPRLKQYEEHVNNHQLQIVQNFSDEGYIKGVFNINELAEAIRNIDNFEPKEYKSSNENMLKIIIDYIENS